MERFYDRFIRAFTCQEDDRHVRLALASLFEQRLRVHVRQIRSGQKDIRGTSIEQREDLFAGLHGNDVAEGTLFEKLHDQRAIAPNAGDTAVFFRAHNAVHLGDVFNNSGYPFIDAGSGGEIDGMIAFCKAALAELEPGAIVIPGHGPVTDVAALERYIAMLETVRDRVSAMIDQGKSLEEVIAAKPTADFDGTYGPVEESLGFLDRVYTSLTKEPEAGD